MNTPQMLPDTVSHTPDSAELMALPIPLMRSDIQSNNHAFLLSKNVGEARSPSRLYGVVYIPRIFQIYRGQVREKTRVARRIAGADSDR